MCNRDKIHVWRRGCTMPSAAHVVVPDIKGVIIQCILFQLTSCYNSCWSPLNYAASCLMLSPCLFLLFSPGQARPGPSSQPSPAHFFIHGGHWDSWAPHVDPTLRQEQQLSDIIASERTETCFFSRLATVFDRPTLARAGLQTTL